MNRDEKGVIRPLSITNDLGEDVLRIAWSDGHMSVYPLGFLRAVCPCVACKLNHKPVDIDAVAPVNGISLLDREKVGEYALKFLWSDTHYTGIYDFGFLRSICRCLYCMSE